MKTVGLRVMRGDLKLRFSADHEEMPHFLKFIGTAEFVIFEKGLSHAFLPGVLVLQMCNINLCHKHL